MRSKVSRHRQALSALFWLGIMLPLAVLAAIITTVVVIVNVC